MAHFAQLDENNIVTQVIVVNNEDTMLDGVENETVGILFCKSIFGADTKWVQTSYNGTFRKNYAAVGYTYDAVRDAFIPPKPFNSWILDEATCRWIAPVPYPEGDSRTYVWNEETKQWELYIGPKPFPSWVLDEKTYLWNPPVPLPDDGKTYIWRERTQEWVESKYQTEEGV